MILGIDASNINGGGALNHLIEILGRMNPHRDQFQRIFIWAPNSTLKLIPDRDELIKMPHSMLNKTLIHRILWQRFLLSRALRKLACDVLFVPGGSYGGSFTPFIAMHQNLLPFEPEEIRRYRLSWPKLRLLLLQFSQARTFRRASGVIFLTEYSRKTVENFLGDSVRASAIISHGIDPKFFNKPRKQKPFKYFSRNRPFRILYVSFAGVYKHQWNVIKAVDSLRRRGLPVTLNLVGKPVEIQAAELIHEALLGIPDWKEFISLSEEVGYQEIHDVYKNADLSVFASSCEAFGQILTEAMAAGLPILSSHLSSMPETLAAAGEYFNPLSVNDIAFKIEMAMTNHVLRGKIAGAAYRRAGRFDWLDTTRRTYSFIVEVKRTETKIAS